METALKKKIVRGGGGRRDIKNNNYELSDCDLCLT